MCIRDRARGQRRWGGPRAAARAGQPSSIIDAMPVDPYTGQVSPRVVPPGPPSTIAAARAEHLALGLPAPAHLDARGVSASPHPMTMCLSLQESGHLSIFSSNPNRPSDFRCEISKEGPWHAYVLLRAEAWASHTLRSDEKKCGCLLYTSPSPRD